MSQIGGANETAAVAERVAALRSRMAGLERALDRLPERPEPLTAGELAARTDTARKQRAPVTPDDCAPTPTSGSLGAAVRALAAGEASAVELVREALERAEVTKSLGAFILLREETLDEARRADQTAPDERGPLHGIPLTLKDIVDVEGITTTSGSRFPHQPARSAPAWQSLADAGAILLGKTNLQEFAFGVTGDNPSFGRAKNPHDPARITGGSSSGSAVEVAAGVSFGSIGTDTGGSIRIPAALTGIFGLKPSYGAVSCAGVTPLSWSLDHVGPLARTAGDIAILWQALSGEAPDPLPSDATPTPLAGIRVGIPQNFFFDNLTPAAKNAADTVEAALVELGAEVIEVRIPEVELSGVSRDVLAFSEAAAVHRERLASRPQDISAEVRTLFRVGAQFTASEYLTALAGRRLVTDAFTKLFEQADVLLAPTTPAGAPEAGATQLDTGEDLRPGLIRLAGPFNLTGLPALQLPAGTDAHGMPLGVQLIGPLAGEPTVIRIARVLEAAGKIAAPTPTLPAKG